MVGSNGTMIAIRLVRSKLRKREEHSHHHHGNAVHPEQVQQCSASQTQLQPQEQPEHQQPLEEAGIVNPAMSGSTTTVDSCCAAAAQSATNTLVAALGNGCTVQPDRTTLESGAGGIGYGSGTTGSAEQFIWQFPPPYPPPNTPPPQYTLYNDQDTLVHGLQTDRQGFAKGFRKNLGGRWRRLVKRKPETETCAIPPELKDQLKTIYVY